MATEFNRIGARIPAHLRGALEQRARENDRSVSAELRRALAAYLSSAESRGTQTQRERTKVAG